MREYLNFWKNSFNYTGQSTFKDLGISILGNMIILVTIYIIGWLVPIHLENVIISVLDVVMLIMLISSIALWVRVYRFYV
ncbi:hypothetical protein AAK913_13255 [Enterococcus faecium]|uniref:hypothetical protein n=1 Tax=Enterococcus TaxID=1350 RepID=UPI0010947F5D|nr:MULTISPECIES: hypothetical protein [Enterococcus]MBK5028399.1 hypothetical protein [Enterococcus faecium]MBK5039039.1 hypothetical protein [Enterococcus faecium]MBK5044113.1 hypothetical protein [Enterococcus faecium]MBK5068902.1 hypothetical protein [Enterococcus faecium]MBK5132275.1 hypothetical protein [Enterococcus faecium]